MGTPIEEPPVIGTDCVTCGYYLWDPMETPLFMKCTFYELIKCDWALYPAPNGEWVLTQVPGSPCTWKYSDGRYNIQVQIGGSSTSVAVTYDPPGPEYYFYGETEDMCGKHCINNIRNCGDPKTLSMCGEVDMDWMNDYPP